MQNTCRMCFSQEPFYYKPDLQGLKNSHGDDSFGQHSCDEKPQHTKSDRRTVLALFAAPWRKLLTARKWMAPSG